MTKLTSEIKDIARSGGGISVDASTKLTSELKEIAQAINASNAFLIIRNADDKLTSELKEIARAAPGKVIFEL